MGEGKSTLNLVFRAPTKIGRNGDKRWVLCDKCGKPQFRLAPVTMIKGLVWECRNPECKHKMIVTVR